MNVEIIPSCAEFINNYTNEIKIISFLTSKTHHSKRLEIKIELKERIRGVLWFIIDS